jgi:hypothetical protein
MKVTAGDLAEIRSWGEVSKHGASKDEDKVKLLGRDSIYIKYQKAGIRTGCRLWSKQNVMYPGSAHEKMESRFGEPHQETPKNTAVWRIA